MKENAKENELVKKLTNKHYTITTAESCTGGLLSATIINVSGASDVINCAYVTYANEAKENLVSVSHETLETKGAVSKETAAEMSVGCAKAAKADIGLSTTGIAGPGGDHLCPSLNAPFVLFVHNTSFLPIVPFIRVIVKRS